MRNQFRKSVKNLYLRKIRKYDFHSISNSKNFRLEKIQNQKNFQIKTNFIDLKGISSFESLGIKKFDLSDEKYVIVLRAFFEGINFRYLVFIWRPAKPRSTFVLKSKASKVALQRCPFKFSGNFLAFN